MIEIKQPLINEKDKEKENDPLSCCYFNIYCGELCYLCIRCCCLFGGISI